MTAKMSSPRGGERGADLSITGTVRNAQQSRVRRNCYGAQLDAPRQLKLELV
jgi:hypothetical protein